MLEIVSIMSCVRVGFNESSLLILSVNSVLALECSNLILYEAFGKISPAQTIKQTRLHNKQN